MVEYNQLRLDSDISVSVVEVFTDVIISHFLRQLHSCLDIASPLSEIRNKVLDHQADIAWILNATVWCHNSA